MFEPAGPAPRAEAFVHIADIGGVPLFFERGASGQAVQTSFPVAHSFVPIVEATVKQVRRRVPRSFGSLERISSAGFQVAKPGLHGLGRACDWDRLVFSNVSISPLARDHASSSRTKRRRYWAFAAMCRSNSSFVLHGLFDRDHEDHIHQDNASGVGFGTASSSVKLCQALLNEIFGETLSTTATSARLRAARSGGPPSGFASRTTFATSVPGGASCAAARGSASGWAGRPGYAPRRERAAPAGETGFPENRDG